MVVVVVVVVLVVVVGGLVRIVQVPSWQLSLEASCAAVDRRIARTLITRFWQHITICRTAAQVGIVVGNANHSLPKGK